MRGLLFILAAVVTTLIAVGTVYQFYVLLYRTELSWIPQREVRGWPWWKRWRMYGAVGAAFIGLTYMIFRGIEGAFWYIPKRWRFTDEYGDTTWVVHSIGLIVAFLAAGFILSKLSEWATAKAQDYWSRKPSERE